MIFGKSQKLICCCKYHVQTFVGVTISSHARRLKVHLFILTIAIINPLCLKIFEYFFHTVFENEGLPFYWVELKTFLSVNGFYVLIQTSLVHFLCQVSVKV